MPYCPFVDTLTISRNPYALFKFDGRYSGRYLLGATSRKSIGKVKGEDPRLWCHAYGKGYVLYCCDSDHMVLLRNLDVLLYWFWRSYHGPLHHVNALLREHWNFVAWEKLVWLISRVLGLTTCACSLHLGVGWSTPLKREESCKPMSRRASSVTLSSLADANEGAKKDK